MGSGQHTVEPDAGVPVFVETDHVVLEGVLGIPVDAAGIVVFAHGSGSGRASPRNRQVARALRESGFATLLLDLLTADEAPRDEATRGLRFNIPLLATRLTSAIDALAVDARTRDLPVGLFGASTGAAAALIAAANRPHRVRAVVSRGGRPDLAADAIGQVLAPTLLLVGGADTAVLDLNQAASGRLRAAHQLIAIPGASHLFEEEGALDQVVAQSTDWFRRHLASPATGQPTVGR